MEEYPGAAPDISIGGLIVRTVRKATARKPRPNSPHHGLVGVDITERIVQVKLDTLLSKIPQHTFYRVHGELRNVHTKSYEPKIIAIGPLHSRNHNLKAMEIHKLQYLEAFLQRKRISKQDCVSAIQGREAEARKCYAEEISLDPTQFLEMLVLDACFIIELALRFEAGRGKDDPILTMPWMRNHILWDLMLFENQIPLFVICEMWKFIRGPETQVQLMELLLKMFEEFYLVKVYYDRELQIDLARVKHLLELIHISFMLTYDDQARDETSMEGKSSAADNVIKSAMRLAESNVSFARTEPVDSIFQIIFRNGCMRLPQLAIYDATESFWRNMIAYEQYFLDCKDCYFTDFAVLMDRLINTKEDVQLLIKFGIIENWLGSEEVVADIFNRLTDNVISSAGDRFTYKPLFKKVRKHCSRRRNSWMAKLKENHFNSPWAIISIFAAFVLLLLTILQTIYTMK